MSQSNLLKIENLDHQLAQTDDPIAMANIYLQAGLIYANAQEIDEACFFMTQAYVFAIHNGEKSIAQTARKYLQIHERI